MNATASKVGQKAHFFIACVELTFMTGDLTKGEKIETGVTRVNTVINSEEGPIGVLLLGRAQQAAQLQLVQKLNDPTIQFLNVIFVSISYLGEQTHEQFHTTQDQVGHG